MKTAKELQQEIDDHVKVCQDKSTALREVKKLKKRISFLRHCKMYLQTEPTLDCLKRQLSGVNKELKIYADRFNEWQNQNYNEVKDIKNIVAYYNKINGITKLKEQVKTLKFIMN